MKKGKNNANSRSASSKKKGNKKGGKQNWAMSLVAVIMCAAVCIYFAVPGLKNLGNAKRGSMQPVAELVAQLQADLPNTASGEFCTITQTGLEVRNDTLAYVYTIEIKKEFEQQYQIGDFQKSFYENGLNSIIDEYGTYRLTSKACDAGMVFTFEYFDLEGDLVNSASFAPEVYKPLLK